MCFAGIKTVRRCYEKKEEKCIFSETLITPEMFAEILCDDLDLPVQVFVQHIAASIRQQLEAHTAVEQASDASHADQRATLKLNVHVSNLSLVDQFEWDMTEMENSPEEFARQLCSDMALGGFSVPFFSYRNVHFQEVNLFLLSPIRFVANWRGMRKRSHTVKRHCLLLSVRIGRRQMRNSGDHSLRRSLIRRWRRRSAIK